VIFAFPPGREDTVGALFLIALARHNYFGGRDFNPNEKAVYSETGSPGKNKIIHGYSFNSTIVIALPPRFSASA
jgi:hypothetical protein